MCEVKGNLGSQNTQKSPSGSNIPKDENGESWQQGNKGQLIVVCTDCTQITRGTIMSVWITQLSWAGAEIGSRCSNFVFVHLAARVTEWPGAGGNHSGLGRKGLAVDIGNRQI